MCKYEVNNWIKASNTDYLKRYTGVKTDSGIIRFKAVFASWADQADSHTPKESKLAIMKDFKAFLQEAK